MGHFRLKKSLGLPKFYSHSTMHWVFFSFFFFFLISFSWITCMAQPLATYYWTLTVYQTCTRGCLGMMRIITINKSNTFFPPLRRRTLNGWQRKIHNKYNALNWQVLKVKNKNYHQTRALAPTDHEIRKKRKM